MSDRAGSRRTCDGRSMALGVPSPAGAELCACEVNLLMASRLARTIERRVSREIGVITRDHGGRLRVCLVYPNTYRVGMSSLGFQAAYHLLNSDPGVVCERAFLPDRESSAELGRTGGDVVSYESQTPLRGFDVIAFSVSYELDYVNVARMLRLARVPVLAGDRDERHPLVIVGGAVTSINPEPLAELVDVFAVGEGEEIVGGLVDALRSGEQRGTALEKAGEAPGAYVTGRGGPAEKAAPPAGQGASAGAPPPGGSVVRQYVSNLDAWPTHSRLLTRETEFGDLFLVEISRGC